MTQKVYHIILVKTELACTGKVKEFFCNMDDLFFFLYNIKTGRRVMVEQKVGDGAAT
jgi:hypothetical protein